jgi:8-oxo-dGTP diphosphatase
MKLATLLYIKNPMGEYLLMERVKEPNKGLMSPPGGKLNTEEGESPSACAVREAHEECGIDSSGKDWLLKGIATEKNYPSIGNIMIFLMEYKNLIYELPETCNEGEFHFVHPDKFKNYNLPVTDNLFIWKNLLKDDGELVMITLDCSDYPDIRQII